MCECHGHRILISTRGHEAYSSFCNFLVTAISLLIQTRFAAERESKRSWWIREFVLPMQWLQKKLSMFTWGDGLQGLSLELKSFVNKMSLHALPNSNLWIRAPHAVAAETTFDVHLGWRPSGLESFVNKLYLHALPNSNLSQKVWEAYPSLEILCALECIRDVVFRNDFYT